MVTPPPARNDQRGTRAKSYDAHPNELCAARSRLQWRNGPSRRNRGKVTARSEALGAERRLCSIPYVATTTARAPKWIKPQLTCLDESAMSDQLSQNAVEGANY
jgi:hypothetical protein